MAPGAGKPPRAAPTAPATGAAAIVLGAAVALAAAVFVGRMVEVEPRRSPNAATVELDPVAFGDIDGWREDDHAAALASFRRSCEGGASRVGSPLHRACRRSALLPDAPGGAEARAFFERSFLPFAVAAPDSPDAKGLLTAYYEPVLPGSRERTERFATPLHGLPGGHVVVTEANRPQGFDPTLVAGRRQDASLTAYPTRGEIQDGALADELTPIVWLENDVDAFFVHIQGSTRIRLPDGGTMRVGYAGKNGHPYSSIGRHMREAGIAPPGGLGMTGIRDHLLAHPDEARRIMAVNRSYIFFREIEGLPPELGPIGAEGVPLTPGRSLAVDRRFHEWGLPVFLEADLGELGRLRRLTVAQDTGSAITGPARGDLFWGTGEEAGREAGQVQARARFIALLPR